MPNPALKKFLMLLALLCILGGIGAYLSTHPAPGAAATAPVRP